MNAHAREAHAGGHARELKQHWQQIQPLGPGFSVIAVDKRSTACYGNIGHDQHPRRDRIPQDVQALGVLVPGRGGGF